MLIFRANSPQQVNNKFLCGYVRQYSILIAEYRDLLLGWVSSMKMA